MKSSSKNQGFCVVSLKQEIFVLMERILEIALIIHHQNTILYFLLVSIAVLLFL